MPCTNTNSFPRCLNRRTFVRTSNLLLLTALTASLKPEADLVPTNPFPSLTPFTRLSRTEALSQLKIFPLKPNDVTLNQNIRTRLESTVYLALLARPERAKALPYIQFSVVATLSGSKSLIAIEDVPRGISYEQVLRIRDDRFMTLLGSPWETTPTQKRLIDSIKMPSLRFRRSNNPERLLEVLLPADDQFKTSEISCDYNTEALRRLNAVSMVLDICTAVLEQGTTRSRFVADVESFDGDEEAFQQLSRLSFSSLYKTAGDPPIPSDVSGTVRQGFLNSCPIKYNVDDDFTTTIRNKFSSSTLKEALVHRLRKLTHEH